MSIHLLDTTVILSLWYLKSLNDAVLFGKGATGDWAYEVWHILDWVRSWALPGYFLYRTQAPWWVIGAIIPLSLGFNHAYRFWRSLNVSQWDNKWRIPWLGKWLDRDGWV